jgi:hypothetical protein
MLTGVDNFRGRFRRLSFTNTTISTTPSNKPAVTPVTMIIILLGVVSSGITLNKDKKIL